MMTVIRTVHCARCEKEQDSDFIDQSAAIFTFYDKGWAFVELNSKKKKVWICPDCR
jgi:hypothetical protein